MLDVLLDHSSPSDPHGDDAADDRSIGRGGDAANEAVARGAHAGSVLPGRVQQSTEQTGIKRNSPNITSSRKTRGTKTYQVSASGWC